jgi:tetratricopeptide (TPR) repeat protein
MEKETLLYKYFEGTLSDKEKAEFDLLLEKDEDFRESLAFEEDVRHVVRDRERNLLKQKLQGYEEGLPKTEKRDKSFWNPLRIAASVAVLLAFGGYFYFTGSAVSTEDLYAENYEKYPNTVYSITRGDETDNTAERRAFEAYEQNDFNRAVSYFEALRTDGNPGYVSFYLAQSYLANGDSQLALNEFNTIIEAGTTFKTEALWYAALCYLKMEKPNEANSLLQELIEEGTFRKKEAENLLEQLQ